MREPIRASICFDRPWRKALDCAGKGPAMKKKKPDREDSLTVP